MAKLRSTIIPLSIGTRRITFQTAPEHGQYEEDHGCKGALLADENRYCERDAEDEVCYYDELAFKRRKLIGKKGQCPLQVDT